MLNYVVAASRVRFPCHIQARVHKAGTAPAAPLLQRNAAVEAASEAAPGTTMTLTWEPAEGSPPVAFFLLDSCGEEGGESHRANNFTTVAKDPPSVSTGTPPTQTFTVTGLLPSTTYLCVFKVACARCGGRAVT